MKEHGGMFWPDADDFMWREMKNGAYQLDHLDAALHYVTDWSCAIDAGAHVGVWTKALAARFEHVIAFEPAADTFECLVENTSDLNNVQQQPFALGSIHGHVFMRLDDRQAARKNTGGRFVEHGGGDIPCLTVDSWNLPSLGFLKLDIEGSEPDAITGAAQTIARCKPVVLFEDKGFCARYGYPKDGSQRLLKGLNYEHRERIGHDEIWTAKP